MPDEYVVLGGGPAIGKVRIDESSIRAEGGPNLPQLVIPIKFELDPQSAGKHFVVTQLKASLFTDHQTFPTSLACPPVTHGMTGGFIAWTMTNGTTSSNSLELRFFPSAQNIEEMELRRRRTANELFFLYLKLEPVVASASHLNQVQPGQELPRSEYDIRFGMHSEVVPFWTSTIQTLWIRIERTTWTERVLPGLGYDRVRLVEVTLPPDLPDHGSAAQEFDRAKRSLSELRFAECVAACRGVISIWEKVLGAGPSMHLAEVVATRLGWPPTDARIRFLDDLWKATNDLSNVPHHPEGQAVAPQEISPSDARLMFLLVASLSEYLGQQVG
jgi:hypothetical protein